MVALLTKSLFKQFKGNFTIKGSLLGRNFARPKNLGGPRPQKNFHFLLIFPCTAAPGQKRQKLVRGGYVVQKIPTPLDGKTPESPKTIFYFIFMLILSVNRVFQNRDSLFFESRFSPPSYLKGNSPTSSSVKGKNTIKPVGTTKEEQRGGKGGL